MNAHDERQQWLRDRLDDAGLHSVAKTIEVPWRTHSVVLQVVFFFLTALGLGAVWGVFNILDVSGPGVVTAVLAIAMAEVLIRRMRWFWTGVEAALWLGGLFLLISELPRSGTPESNLVIAAASGIAGARVRNPLFGALAAIFVVLYFEERFNLGVVSALVIAAIALAALLRTWVRPSTDWLFVAVALVMPVAGRFTGDEIWRIWTIVLYAIFGVATLLLAIRVRRHTFYFTGFIALGIAAVDAAEHLALPLPVEAKLALGGALLLAGSWLASRALRDHTTGTVATPASLTPFDDDLQAAAITALPRPDFESPATSSGPEPGGGEFGGAGATGKF